MRFDELPLYIAVWRVRGHATQPGSDHWIGRHARSLYRLVLDRLIDDGWDPDDNIPWSMTKVIDAWIQLRKQPKLRLTCKVAIVHGCRCFYASRDLGPCSEDVDLDRILPGSLNGRYTVPNCMIACSVHNRSRQDRTIEEFIHHPAKVDDRVISRLPVLSPVDGQASCGPPPRGLPLSGL